MRGGGGTRIKILEAAAFGIPVVADRDSAAALFGWDRPWGWCAPNAAGFVAACAEALRDGAERERRGRFGYNAVARSHARPAVVARLAQILRGACAPGAQPRG
jgi:glycosyltransferase involved in cell wall biosynthesis